MTLFLGVTAGTRVLMCTPVKVVPGLAAVVVAGDVVVVATTREGKRYELAVEPSFDEDDQN